MSLILDYLTRPRSSSTITLSRPCDHNICSGIPYCLKIRGEQLMSDTNSLNTIFEQSFEQFFDLPPSEEEASHEWDPEIGWRVTCNLCRKDRCKSCGGEVFESVTDFRKSLTAENRRVWICGRCMHKCCPGLRVKLVSRCFECGHRACRLCFREREEPVCCSCGPTPIVMPKSADGKGSLSESEAEFVLHETYE